jgi:hypothetical protein
MIRAGEIRTPTHSQPGRRGWGTLSKTRPKAGWNQLVRDGRACSCPSTPTQSRISRSYRRGTAPLQSNVNGASQRSPKENAPGPSLTAAVSVSQLNVGSEMRTALPTVVGEDICLCNCALVSASARIQGHDGDVRYPERLQAPLEGGEYEILCRGQDEDRRIDRPPCMVRDSDRRCGIAG